MYTMSGDTFPESTHMQVASSHSIVHAINLSITSINEACSEAESYRLVSEGN